MIEEGETLVRTRNPIETHERLLEAAFGEIHANGYLAANMDTVVERAGVTRGALYHHFGSKKGLAQAVIDGAALPPGLSASMAIRLLECAPIVLNPRDEVQVNSAHRPESSL